MTTKQATKKGKAILGRLGETVVLLVPAVLGGAAGAGLGRQSIWIGGALYTMARQFNWPIWAETAALGMSVNGVATTQAVTETQKQAEQVSAEELAGGFLYVPDNALERSEQYLKNMLLSLYADKVPVLNKAVGLAGVDDLKSFKAGSVTDINLNPSVRTELSRLMQKREALPAAQMGNVDAAEFEGAYAGVAGVDAAEFSNPTSTRARSRRRAA